MKVEAIEEGGEMLNLLEIKIKRILKQHFPSSVKVQDGNKGHQRVFGCVIW